MKNRLFTKFCGITQVQDAINAQEAGCNALGFVFVKSSKRYLDSIQCNKIINEISPLMITVGLFANNAKEQIESVINQCNIQVLQFHGSESSEFCEQFKRPYWKAIPMADAIDPVKYATKHPNALGYVIDNYGQNQQGGSGDKFDWKELPKNLGNKWILAGGLTVDNIKEARQNTSLNSFDVSSGIEVSPGIKSKQKMNQFIKNLND